MPSAPVGLKAQPAWGYVTRSKTGDHLYLIVRQWPADGMLHVPVVVEASAAHVMGDGARPSVESGKAGLTIDLAGAKPTDANATVIVVDVEGEIGLPPDSGGDEKSTTDPTPINADIQAG